MTKWHPGVVEQVFGLHHRISISDQKESYGGQSNSMASPQEF